MSTTIQYKGNTLATVSNNTKTLKTAGKYMEGDVVLTDVSGGSVTQDQDGFIVLPPDGSGGGGGTSGLVYETGTFTPSADIVLPNISFSNGHDTPPTVIHLHDDGTGFTPSTNCVIEWGFYDLWSLTGRGVPSSSGTSYCYMEYTYLATNRGIGGSRTFFDHTSAETGSTTAYPEYYVTKSNFRPYGSSSRVFLSGRTYKWIAVWAPTT